MEATKETREGKEATNEIGKTFLTVTKTINNVLLPIAAVNYAFDKGREYFEKRFAKDLEEKTKNIPEIELREPKASLSAPTLQGLAFSHNEMNLKELYLQLLATSMDARKAGLDHPSYAEIIRQLTSEEAHFLREILENGKSLPICQIKRSMKNHNGEIILKRHVINAENRVNGLATVVPGISAMIDNWIRLGLISVNYSRSLVGEGLYEWIERRPEYALEKLKEAPDGDEINYTKGVLRGFLQAELCKRVCLQYGAHDGGCVASDGNGGGCGEIHGSSGANRNGRTSRPPSPTAHLKMSTTVGGHLTGTPSPRQSGETGHLRTMLGNRHPQVAGLLTLRSPDCAT